MPSLLLYSCLFVLPGINVTRDGASLLFASFEPCESLAFNYLAFSIASIASIASRESVSPSQSSAKSSFNKS